MIRVRSPFFSSSSWDTQVGDRHPPTNYTDCPSDTHVAPGDIQHRATSANHGFDLSHSGPNDIVGLRPCSNGLVNYGRFVYHLRAVISYPGNLRVSCCGVVAWGEWHPSNDSNIESDVDVRFAICQTVSSMLRLPRLF